MTAHTHTSVVEGCYRCELGKDEVRMSLSCPECCVGKHVNCTHQALGNDDQFIPCRCEQERHPR